MFRRQIGNIVNFHKIIIQNFDTDSICGKKSHYLRALFSTVSSCLELPMKLKKSERKPMVTPVNELKRIARAEKKERLMVEEVKLSPPENGLLVKELVPVAHEVLAARADLFACVSRVVASIPIYSCRLGRAVSHDERLQVDQIPAIVELCVQAGVDILEYPTRRREFPIYRVAGRMIDFERRFPKDDSSVKEISGFGFWEDKKKLRVAKKPLKLSCDDIRGLSSWHSSLL
ncbi:hypothetical protein RJ639_047288 [Escallonia herrerae]|uniref:APO domain-containing protein n=1 Tax=Escallonia herrerae TaxID=1293975 RepID=A0AA88W4L8_9ASTE|nr:hypothetical protein RJ639_047288 [Escallonia herrerae]